MNVIKIKAFSYHLMEVSFFFTLNVSHLTALKPHNVDLEVTNWTKFKQKLRLTLETLVCIWCIIARALNSGHSRSMLYNDRKGFDNNNNYYEIIFPFWIEKSQLLIIIKYVRSFVRSIVLRYVWRTKKEKSIKKKKNIVKS